MKISTIIIVKNAENLILDCIKSVNFSDEIIVVDSGSTDKTKEVAEKEGAKIISLKSNDFSELRNTGLYQAKGDLIFYLDADERPDVCLQEELKALKQKNDTESFYEIQRKNFYLGDHEWPKIEKIDRVFKKNCIKKWVGELHEHPITEGKRGKLSGYLNHYTHSDLTSMLNKTIKWSQTEAELRYKANHPKMSWWRFPRVMLSAFFRSYVIEKGYKVGTAGLIESIFQSFSIFATYAKLWELQEKSKFKNSFYQENQKSKTE